MLTPTHKFYRNQEDDWDPRKILEWGLTFYDRYSPDSDPAAISTQKAAIEIMLKESCKMVKAHVKRQIYWLLQNKYKTFSTKIESVFGKIFVDLEDMARGKQAS